MSIIVSIDRLGYPKRIGDGVQFVHVADFEVYSESDTYKDGSIWACIRGDSGLQFNVVTESSLQTVFTIRHRVLNLFNAFPVVTFEDLEKIFKEY